MMTHETMFARYRIVQELGRGATGAVYAARDHATGTMVALKTVDLALLKSADPSLAGHFLKSARSARRLRHDNIVRVHDAGEVAGTAFVAMEMLDGESLRKILDAGPLPVARAIRIARDIACGLAYAHLEGVVHGALKPSNILVLPSGAVKISDFALGLPERAGLPSGARPAGLSYMSPEQLRGDPVDHRSDIFSLGALFYEMLTQRLPFEGASAKEIAENIVRARPPRPSELNEHVPRIVDGVVCRMLAAEPAARMPGAPIVLRELQRLEEGLGLASSTTAATDAPAASTPPAEPKPKPKPRTQPQPQVRADAPAAGAVRRRNRAPEHDAFDYHEALARMERESRRERAARSRQTFATLAVVVAVLGLGAAGFTYYSKGLSQRDIAAARVHEMPETAPGPGPLAQVEKSPARTLEPQQPGPLPDAMVAGEAKHESRDVFSEVQETPPKPPVAKPAPSAQEETLVAREAEPSASAGAAAPAPAPKPEPARTAQPTSAQPTSAAREQPARRAARLVLVVSPRGELYVDGQHRGTTPPLTTFDLEPGMHRIEVRSGSRTPYLTYVTVEAGEVRRIRHDFDTSRAVYPSKNASWQSGPRKSARR